MMINIDSDSVGNNTVIKFGGYDESSIASVTQPHYYAKEFPTVPGTWTISLPYSYGGIYWMAPMSHEKKLPDVNR